MGWISDIGDLFGSEETSSTLEFGSELKNVRANVAGVGTKQLQLDPAAIQQIIKDVLGADDGLAAIFSAENQAGIFDSSVAQQALGDLVSNIIGELAKVTGKEVATENRSQEQSESTESTRSSNTINRNAGALEMSGLEELARNVDNEIGWFGFVEDLNPIPPTFEEQIQTNREIIGDRDDEDEDESSEESGSIVDENTAKSDEMAAKITDIVLAAVAGG